ncbi:MAG: hypothetical protein IJ524_00540 [Bacteroidales bacterium]|nr:hypothetical protein [Bacteroidales bacterium]
MKKTILMVLAMTALASSATLAQSSFTLKVGASIPTGKFGDATANNGSITRWGLTGRYKEGGAGMGFNIGAEWRFGIKSANGLGIAVSIDGFCNGMNEEISDAFDNILNVAEDEGVYASITKPLYINLPVMAGANYKLDATPNLAVFTTAAAGLNMRIITPIIIKGNEDNYSSTYGTVSTEETMTISYKPTFTFGFKLAAGIEFNNKYTIEVSYYNLGAGKVKTKIEDDYSSSIGNQNSDSERQTLRSITPEIINVRLGIRF